MANALAFIGGGLLQGVGTGIKESGRQKREDVLDRLAHERDLERDERRGLIDEGLLNIREAGATERLEKSIFASRTAADLVESRRSTAADLAFERTSNAPVNVPVTSRRVNPTTGEEIVPAAVTPKGSSAGEDQLEIKRILERFEEGFDEITGAKIINHKGAAVAQENNGFKIAVAEQRAKANAVAATDTASAKEEYVEQRVNSLITIAYLIKFHTLTEVKKMD